MASKHVTDARLVKKAEEANGNYYEVAAEIGEAPVRVGNRLLAMKDLSPELRGKIAVWRKEGQRLQRARKFQQENALLRRDLRAATDFANLGEELTKVLERKDWPKRKRKQGEGCKELLLAPDVRPMEILFSDLHYGKTCEGFSPEAAECRVEQYSDAVRRLQKRYNPTHTTIAFLGDIVENANKHRDSQTGSGGMTTAEQIVGAFRSVKRFLEQVLPGAGKIVDIVGVSGNHENPFGSGASMAAPGASHYTYIIYSLLADFFEGWAANGIEWHVPRGNFAFVSRTRTIYEHGDAVKPDDKSMADQLIKRSRQVGEFCEHYRQGDKHVAVAADSGRLVCNGAFYSDRAGTEYSGIMGYSSQPSQVIVVNKDIVKFVRLT